MAQKIEVDILLKVFNVVSPQEKSQHLQNISSFVSLQKAFEKFSIKTSYLVEKHLSFVIRKEIKLTDGISEDHTFQYVSILRLIEVLLLKKDVQKYVFSSGVTESDELICEFKVGLIFKNNTTRTSSDKTLYIMLYCDGFVFATPLGNKVKQCKISAFYVVLKQLTKKKRFNVEFN